MDLPSDDDPDVSFEDDDGDEDGASASMYGIDQQV